MAERSKQRGDEATSSHRRDTIVTTAVGLGTYGLSVITGPLLARSLGTADRGTYAAVWAPTQLIGWLLMLGIPAASAYYAREDNRGQLDAGAWLATVVVGVPAVVLLWPLVPLSCTGTLRRRWAGSGPFW